MKFGWVIGVPLEPRAETDGPTGREARATEGAM
jgi:hypothetical protein